MQQVNERVSSIRETALKVGEIYETRVKKGLETQKDSIAKTLNDLVCSNAKDYELVLTNDSSKDIKLFELIGRVKQKESLVEKVIRNQIFGFFIAKTDDEIINEIYRNIDDLIGLRFLVSLSCDCKKVFEIVRNNREYLLREGIEFGADIDNNPQKMQNGRPIYRIKGKHEQIHFELQIKSQVDSAWADIEHMLFYKDYQFSYIQNTNKSIMNKIGDLLSEVDELMIQIRDSQLRFEQEREQLEFNQHLGNSYKDFLKEKLISASTLRDNKNILFKLYKTFNHDEQGIIIQHMEKDADHDNHREIYEFVFPKSGISTLMSNYQKLKESCIDFIVYEDIYLDWISSIDAKKEIRSSELTDDILEEYLEPTIRIIIEENTSRIISNIIEYQEVTIHNDSIIDFSEKIAQIYLDTISNVEFSNPPSQLLFDTDFIYMYFCYLQVLNSIDSLWDCEADMALLNRNVARYFLDESSIDEVKAKMSNIILRLFGNQIDDILQQIDQEYKKRPCTESGKRPKENRIMDLFEGAMKIAIGGDNDE